MDTPLPLLDLDALRRIGLTLDVIRLLMDHPPAPGQRLMRVAEVQRDALQLHDGHDQHPARQARALWHELDAQGQALAVGDWVLATRPPHSPWQAERRVPPVRQIVRRTASRAQGPHGAVQRQVLVSHVDTALLVMGLDHDFNPRRLERYQLLATHAGLRSVLVLTKADACAEALRRRRVDEAQAVLGLAVPVLAVDGREADARRQLGPWLQPGSTLVLLGSSGAGKSTLTNTLTGVAAAHSGAVRVDDSRGRHTTTVRTLHPTPEGACIIDTPGLRALRLDLGHEEAVDEAFDDITRWAAHCRFRNCRHGDEPGCAVRDEVDAQRLAHWRRLGDEARRDRLMRRR